MGNKRTSKRQLSIFVSLRYGCGDLIERALSKILSQKGYSVFLHTLTADSLTRADSPFVLESCGLKLITYNSVTHQPPPNPSVFSPDLFFKLVRSIGTQDGAVILWSATYWEGFWSRLELNTVLAMAKPMILIRIDDEPLSEPLLRAEKIGKHRVIELDEEFMPSLAAAEIERAMNSHSSPGPLDLTYDTLTSTRFIGLHHPVLEDFEISDRPLTYGALINIAPLNGPYG